MQNLRKFVSKDVNTFNSTTETLSFYFGILRVSWFANSLFSIDPLIGTFYWKFMKLPEFFKNLIFFSLIFYDCFITFFKGILVLKFPFVKFNILNTYFPPNFIIILLFQVLDLLNAHTPPPSLKKLSLIFFGPIGRIILQKWART